MNATRASVIRPPRGRPAVHRMMLAPQASPPPNAVVSTTSPGWSRPWRHAWSIAIGIEADEVLPDLRDVHEQSLVRHVQAVHDRQHDARVGLVGDHERHVVGGHAGLLQQVRARLGHAGRGALEDRPPVVHAQRVPAVASPSPRSPAPRSRRRRWSAARWPCRRARASSRRRPARRTAPAATAPAPSPNRTHVVRSVMSSVRESVSAPTTRTRSAAPAVICAAPTLSAYTNPAHAAFMSKAAQCIPSRCWM